MFKFEYSPNYTLASSTNFNYAYSSSSSFVDITGAGSSSKAMTITEGKVMTSYEMTFDANATGSGAVAIATASPDAIASPENRIRGTLKETFAPIPTYLNFSQELIDDNFTRNTDNILTDVTLIKLGAIANDGIFDVVWNTVDLNCIIPFTHADFTAVPSTFQGQTN